MDLERLTTRAAEIAERESADLLTRTTASKALYERAVKSLPSGVASNFQVGDPYPVYLEKGRGSSVWDVDGTEYKDFHGGFGVNVVGHANPKIVEALKKAAEEAVRGEHYAAGREYARYREGGGAEFYAEGLSLRYEGSRQLVALGLMGPGRWF